MMSDFEYDCWQRKRIAQQAKYRKCGSKSKKCSMSTDHMTQKQWKERNGKVVTVNLNQPITWDDFKALTASMQEEYLKHMMENYGANATSFAAMFGVQPLTIRRHIQMNKLNIKFPVGHSMSTAQKDAWDELLHGKTSDEDAEVEVEDVPATKLDEAASKQSMDMKRFSLCFNGRIDVNMKFMSDEELRNAMDEFIDSVKDDVAADEEKTTVLNPMKLQQMQFAHAALKYITRDSDVEVSYKLNTPFKTMGSISVEGETLAFDKPEWFARVAEFANNMEVYPLVKNRVRLTFTFHGLTKPIE